MSNQHSPTTINRQHVLETSVEYLLKQISNQKLHVANLLAKTGDTESYTYLQEVFSDIQDAIVDIRYDAIEEVLDYYNNQRGE